MSSLTAIEGAGKGTDEWASAPGPGFCHEALFYACDADFLAATVPFVRHGLEQGEPVLAVLGKNKLTALRTALGAEAKEVIFADMDQVGANPARIIPAWHAFVDRLRPGSAVRGIGEPITAARSAEEIVECHRHEALLNVAFEHSSAFWLLCPYDTMLLDGTVLAEAERNHPSAWRNGDRCSSERFPGVETLGRPLESPLSPPPAGARRLAVNAPATLALARQEIAAFAEGAGWKPAAIGDLLIAVNEILTNSLRHGGGHGEVLIWNVGESLVCEVRDRGRFLDPMADRRPPAAESTNGRGLWMANQLCDLLQIRSLPGGTAFRLHIRPPD